MFEKDIVVFYSLSASRREIDRKASSFSQFGLWISDNRIGLYYECRVNDSRSSNVLLLYLRGIDCGKGSGLYIQSSRILEIRSWDMEEFGHINLVSLLRGRRTPRCSIGWGMASSSYE